MDTKLSKLPRAVSFRLLNQTYNVITQKFYALSNKFTTCPPTKNPPASFLTLPRELRLRILLQTNDLMIQRVHTKCGRHANIALECTNHPAIDAWFTTLMRVSHEGSLGEDIEYCRRCWYEEVQIEVRKPIEWR
ncbi:hypothetical protein Vi05172_g12077 [Venturia inaequalis]|nr:hypothetical protein Vi05172_g12077 [Venturia inaequalis]